MLITDAKFIKAYCVRKKDHITNPPIHEIKDFIFPRNSQLHFLKQDDDQIGIKATNPLLANNNKGKVISEFVLEYSKAPAEGFKRVEKDLKEEVRSYMKMNKGIENAAFAKSDMNLDKNLIVTNYGLMETNVNYFNHTRQWWIRFQNYWTSVFTTVSEKVKSNKRNHFIMLDVPELMPAISQFKKFAEQENNQAIDKIANEQRMLIAQFWLALAHNARSIIPTDPNVLNRLFFIFVYQDRWMCFRLSTIFEQIKTPQNTKGSWDVQRTQRNFVAMLLALKYGVVPDLEEEIIDELTPPPQMSKGEEKEINNNLKDDTLQTTTLNDDNTIKGKLSKAFDAIEVEVDEKNDLNAIDERKSRKIDAFLEELEEINQDVIAAPSNPDIKEGESILKTDEGEDVGAVSNTDLLIDYQEYQPKELTREEHFDNHLKNLVVKGSITPQQMGRLEKVARRYKEIPDPKTGTGTLETAAIINPEDLTLTREKKFVDKVNMVNDESMLKSTLIDFNAKYVENVMHKDVYNAVLAVQKHGIAVQNYQVKRVTQLGDDYEVHSVKLVPLEGEPSTISFKIPIVDDHGIFLSRSLKMHMGTQRVDVPIRKVGPDEVALTSYMSKMFVHRSTFAAYSKEQWLRGQLLELGGADNGVNISFGGSFNRDEVTPLTYSQFSRQVKRIRFKDYDLNFDISKLNEFFGEEVVKAFEPTRNTQILLGKGKNTLLVLSDAGIVHECSIDQKENVELGYLEDFIGLDLASAPQDCADLNVVSKKIPIGVVIAYYVGLGNLLKTLKVKHHFVPKGTRGVTEVKGHTSIRFADGTLVINTQGNYKAQLVFQGFNRYHKAVKRFSMIEFDKKTVYGAIFADAGLPARYLREFNILKDMWVDPITEAELKRMGEPTDFVMLLLRSVELLEKDNHPHAMERAYQRDRGLERISGMVYDSLISAIRAYDSTPVRSKAKVTMNPEEVWMKIIGDDTTSPIEESNPIHSLKEIERVVYRGAGGRSSRTMNSANRVFTKSAIGVDSDSTVDNGDAGTIKFLTANPNYNSLRGTIDILDKFDESVNASCLNTSELLAPAIELDDPKRRSFLSIQNSRTTNSVGATILPTRTGYENVLAYRTSDLYATIAKEEGTVVRVTEHAVVVQYKSGKEVTVELGKRDGRWSGKIIPHNVITELKEGQKVKVGDAIAYNPMFFARDTLSGNLAYKTGVLGRIALVEGEFTNEDSSTLWAGITDKFVTKNCEIRSISVPFDKDVLDLVKVGTEVDYDDVLCVLRNNLDGVSDKFMSSSLDALRDVSSTSPRAKHTGRVTDISAVYVGDVEDMSPTLQAIVSASDRRLYKKARDMNKERVTGQMRSGARRNGKTLEPNTVVIDITIDISQEMGTGSKVVFGHQMKSVVSAIFTETLTSQDGVPYDGTFSYTSYIKRIVESTILAGLCNTFSVNIGKAACEIYEKE